MSLVEKIERQQTALSLVRIGLRLSYIRAVTGLTEKSLRDIWKEVHKTRPSSGTSYNSIDTGLKTYTLARQSAAFANVYLTSAQGAAQKSLHAKTFLDAWMTFVDLGVNENLTPNMAWQVIRNLTSKTTSFKQCVDCKSGYIVYEKTNGKNCQCPFCNDAAIQKKQVAVNLISTRIPDAPAKSV